MEKMDSQDLPCGLQAEHQELVGGSKASLPASSCLRDRRVVLRENEGNESRDEQK